MFRIASVITLIAPAAGARKDRVGSQVGDPHGASNSLGSMFGWDSGDSPCHEDCHDSSFTSVPVTAAPSPSPINPTLVTCIVRNCAVCNLNPRSCDKCQDGSRQISKEIYYLF